MFIDEVEIFVKAGDGGHGVLSFRREKFIPRGGPDGGHGGNGGSIWLEATPHISTLLDFHYQRHYSAGRGEHGKGSDQHGASARDLTLRVPVGTTVWERDSGILLGDLTEPGQRLLVAEGGRGGRGNSAFASSTNRAPRRIEAGLPGEERWLRLELRLLADVGVIGFPNAGKSTLVSRLSAATPKIADYPFTTLIPHLGVVRADEEFSFVIADLPGLIPGAALGKGLGHRFLRHTERTRLLIHLIDLDPSTGRDPVQDYLTIQEELHAFSAELAERPQIVAANKLDIPESRARLRAVEGFCAKHDLPCVPISAATGEGCQALVRAVADRRRVELWRRVAS